ncbi:DUF1254 domain-containing protein [Mycoplana sp. MJR14]|uniref:DUF1254 domain-containing protein n=1 Tax=Mycoplana sp. MJR14 TaxID=3032583 RepID=UPI0023DB0CAC|nr:DUF1254 domain-containing protein [Mycoplana sp. MJR14]MDF1635575.1 DUF1254 domain-containing protein [Mycoplana sp. MJR14]
MYAAHDGQPAGSPALYLNQRWLLSDYIDPAQTFITCPNQDVVYGLGFFDLDKQPVVAQVPDFGDRFWVYALYDARTDQFADLGKPYGSQPGFYLLVGPNWKGEVPDGITGVFHSPTSLANGIPRIFQDDTPEDKAAIQRLIDQVVFYPLTEGEQLEGSKTYSITFPEGQEPPVNGFWSLTLYNEEHFLHPNDLKRYSLGTKNKSLKRNADGSLTLYAGAKNPGGDKESNWLPAPEGTFSLYIRAYWGKEPILDGSSLGSHRRSRLKRPNWLQVSWTYWSGLRQKAVP